MLRNFAFRHILIFLVVRGTMYSVEFLSRVPCMTILLVFMSMMLTFLSLKSANHPLSQNMPIERSDLFFRSGQLCACRSEIGRLFCGSKAMCD